MNLIMLGNYSAIIDTLLLVIWSLKVSARLTDTDNRYTSINSQHLRQLHGKIKSPHSAHAIGDIKRAYKEYLAHSAGQSQEERANAKRLAELALKGDTLAVETMVDKNILTREAADEILLDNPQSLSLVATRKMYGHPGMRKLRGEEYGVVRHNGNTKNYSVDNRENINREMRRLKEDAARGDQDAIDSLDHISKETMNNEIRKSAHLYLAEDHEPMKNELKRRLSKNPHNENARKRLDIMDHLETWAMEISEGIDRNLIPFRDGLMSMNAYSQNIRTLHPVGQREEDEDIINAVSQQEKIKGRPHHFIKKVITDANGHATIEEVLVPDEPSVEEVVEETVYGGKPGEESSIIEEVNVTHYGGRKRHHTHKPHHHSENSVSSSQTEEFSDEQNAVNSMKQANQSAANYIANKKQKAYDQARAEGDDDKTAAIKADAVGNSAAERIAAQAAKPMVTETVTGEDASESSHGSLNGADFLKKNIAKKKARKAAKKAAKAAVEAAKVQREAAMHAAEDARQRAEAAEMAKAVVAPIPPLAHKINKDKAIEEEMAEHAEQAEIENARNIGYANTKHAGKSEEEAIEEGEHAARAKAAQIAKEKHQAMEEMEEVYAHQMPWPQATEHARHAAIAHSGRNPTVFSQLTDADRASKNCKNGFVDKDGNCIAGTSVEEAQNSIMSVVPDTASSVPLKKATVNLPLAIAHDVRAETEEEQHIKNNQENLRDKLRNTHTKKKIPTGLNVVEEEGGYFNLPESAKKIKVKKGTVYYTPQAYHEMEEAGLDTSALQPHTSNGTGSIPTGEPYYSAEVEEMSMTLPTLGNPTPSKMLSNGNDSFDLTHASKMIVEEGEVEMIPWKTFSGNLRPKVYKPLTESEEEASEEAVQELKAQEIETNKLNNAQVDLVKNDKGEEMAHITPVYGNTATVTPEEAYDTLKPSGADSSESGSSEEMTHEEGGSMAGGQSNSSESGESEGSEADSEGSSSYEETSTHHLIGAANDDELSEQSEWFDQFIAGTSALNSQHPDILTKNNPFDGSVDSEFEEVISYSKPQVHLRPTNTPGNNIYNNILMHSEYYSNAFGMPVAAFEEAITNLDPSVWTDYYIFYKSIAGNHNFNTIIPQMPTRSFMINLHNVFSHKNPMEIYTIFSPALRSVTNLPDMINDKITNVTSLSETSVHNTNPSGPIVKSVVSQAGIGKDGQYTVSGISNSIHDIIPTLNRVKDHVDPTLINRIKPNKNFEHAHIMPPGSQPLNATTVITDDNHIIPVPSIGSSGKAPSASPPVVDLKFTPTNPPVLINGVNIQNGINVPNPQSPIQYQPQPNILNPAQYNQLYTYPGQIVVGTGATSIMPSQPYNDNIQQVSPPIQNNTIDLNNQGRVVRTYIPGKHRNNKNKDNNSEQPKTDNESNQSQAQDNTTKITDNDANNQTPANNSPITVGGNPQAPMTNNNQAPAQTSTPVANPAPEKNIGLPRFNRLRPMA